jgi:hypothetical protein
VSSSPLRIAGQNAQLAPQRFLFHHLWHFLAQADSPQRSDVIFVLAGRPERKAYGLQLFREEFGPRLILSVGRFEVRRMGSLGFDDLNLRERAVSLPPDQRHFFIDLLGDSRKVILRGDAGKGTHAELLSLGQYLEADQVASLLIISTSIHLGRVRRCCGRSVFFRGKEISYVPVPEPLSSVRCAGWWKYRNHWSYVLSEYAKTAILLLRSPRTTR